MAYEHIGWGFIPPIMTRNDQQRPNTTYPYHTTKLSVPLHVTRRIQRRFMSDFYQIWPEMEIWSNHKGVSGEALQGPGGLM